MRTSASPDPAAASAAPKAPSRDRSPPSGTAHVRRLAHFLQKHLDRADLEELHLELDRDHYVGSNEVRLLEHCVSMADPVDFLTSRFTRSQLQRHLRSECGIDAGAADHRLCAERLLTAFGFPSAPALRGPRQVLQALRVGRAEIASSDLVRLRGAVTGASSQLEYLVIVLLRFLCLAAFREAPEPHFRSRGRLEASRAIDGCPLGKLLELLELLGRELQTDDTPTVRAFQHDFNTRSLAPEGSLRVTQLRNRFAHFGPTSQPMDLPSARRAAVEFFDEAIAFVEHLLAEPRIFPRIVRVERIVHDRWGRKTVHALDDEGIQETIFSDHPLQPGRAYYMHPISNPLRVDPILVDAGDAVGP